MKTKAFRLISCVLQSAFLAAFVLWNPISVYAADDNIQEAADKVPLGGGYAATEQIDSMGYMSKLYDATNGLVTSDANDVLCASDGSVLIGGYSGITRYDGSSFTKLDPSDGLTSGRDLFEDSQHRIWVGTNDNGVVVLDGNARTHFTDQEKLTSMSIRSFAEDKEGNVFIGTTAGVCYVDTRMELHVLDDERLNEERILRLDADAQGRIYGYTKNGSAFLIEDKQLSEIYTSDELGTEKITTIMADPVTDNNVYIGTSGNLIYYGKFGSKAENMKRISVSPMSDIHFISYDCGRVWATSTTAAGYLDENEKIHILEDIPVNSGIEMSTSDYQGNMWFASSRQGVMKLVASSFVDVTGKAELPAEVANAVCLYGNNLYIGTDKGLQILDKNGKQIENELTEYIGEARIRCIENGSDNDMWIGMFTNDLGLIRVSKDGTITSFTKADGMPSNEIRCISAMKNGNIMVGTNHGLAIISGDQIIRSITSDDVQNTIFLDVKEGENGELYICTDGDGIYVVNGADIKHISRNDGLTSDVVMRIKHDDVRDLYWIITSNSVEYMTDGMITCVTTFPYNNNYDLYFGENDSIWFISSCGIYVVDAEELVQDYVTDYRLYTAANGLTSTPTGNAFCALSDNGTLYVPVRSGVCSVNTRSSAEGSIAVKAAVSSVYCGDTEILPESNGSYTIPASDERIRITASVFDYSLTDPQVQIYLEGKEKDGISTTLSRLTPLDYTDLGYGNYKLHIKVIGSSDATVLLDKTFRIEKQPQLKEQLTFRLTLMLLALLLAGIIAWRVTRSLLMRRQYEELKRARNDALIATRARTNFLASMSHELLTPINTIVGMNEMTMRENPSERIEEYSANIRNYAMDIRNASESLKYLVSDLLDMSDLESGRMRVCVQEYDTAAALKDIITLIRNRCKEKGIDFTVNAEEMLPRRMSGDIAKIKHILINLLNNSVKFTDIGGIILTVSLLQKIGDDCILQFSVKDTGMGMDETIVRNLFNVYDTIGENGKNGAINTGVALGLSHRFAELMGGSLTCESEPGKGTEFVLMLNQKIVDKTPIGAFIEQTENVIVNYTPLFRAPDADILVVSNDVMTVKVIKGFLKRTEAFVTTASNIEACSDKMKGTRFHVILFDFMLSDADGGYPKKLREKNKDVPVYVITSTESMDEVFYKSRGYQGCIFKPIDGMVLEKTLKKHLPGYIMDIPEDLAKRR
ncbi:MAG: response regulator [Oscillospiraceae bacterium]|nr:response regulator [Oscillospiraceae bacterium]